MNRFRAQLAVLILLGCCAGPASAALPGWLEPPRRSNPLDPKSPLNKTFNPTPQPTPAFNHAWLHSLGGWGYASSEFISVRRVKWAPGGGFVVFDQSSFNEQYAPSTFSYVKSFKVYITYPWGSTSDPASSAYGFAFDASGNLHAPDSNSRVRALDAATFDSSVALYESSAGCMAPPDICFAEGIAFTGAGNIILADTGNNRLKVLDSSYAFTQSVGSGGSGPGLFNGPCDVEVSAAGDWFVVDRSNHRVQKFNGAGAWQLSFGGLGSGAGQLSGPSDLSVGGPSNFVYVADTGNKRLAVFNTSGVWQYNQSYTPQTGFFDQVTAVDVDATGRLVVGQNSSSISVPRVFVLGAWP